MAENPIKLLGAALEPTIRFGIPLRPPAEDLARFPWLVLGDGQTKLRDRYYTLGNELARGGFSIAILGYPSDAQGVKHPGSMPVVIKLPNLDMTGRVDTELDRRRETITQQSFEEWELARMRLLDCKYANPVFDLGDIWLGDPLRNYVVSAQLYLEDALPLKSWLRHRGLRAPARQDSAGREIDDNWGGIADWAQWLRVATAIAAALADVHQRRVIHGDIWPPNVFFKTGEDAHAIFIDFGESFGFMPSGAPRIQNFHAYRAPERGGREYVPTEQVDVYSFGMLLLYLATGREVAVTESHSGYARRRVVRAMLHEHNRSMVRSNPRACDIIMRCIALDPARRPAISEIYRDLKDAAVPRPRPKVEVVKLTDKLASIGGKIGAAFKDGPSAFTSLIDERLDEIEELVESCRTGVVNIGGTRNQLLQAMQRLFDDLRAGDSWTGITTPSVWQGSALGLDGRYFTATVEAVQRGAAVHRTFVFAVEELGVAWSTLFANNLAMSGDPVLDALAAELRLQVLMCGHQSELGRLQRQNAMREAATGTPGSADRDDAFTAEHRVNFSRVLMMLKSAVEMFGLLDKVSTQFTTIQGTKGLYVGLLPTATLSQVRELRVENPVALMYSQAPADDKDRWTLVMTDMLGRNETLANKGPKPQLRRVRVYRSVRGIPRERIVKLERLLSTSSFNIGCRLNAICNCLPPV